MYDAIIAGLGGMGSAAAYQLAQRGKKILGIDQYAGPHDKGSSHGESRIIRQAYHEDPAYVPLVLRAYELWHDLEREAETQLLYQTGGLMIGPPGSSVVEGTIRSATEHSLPYEVMDAKELARRFPALNPRPNETAVYEVKAGFVRPEAAVRAHLQGAVRGGAEFRFGERVHGWSAAGGSVKVSTDSGAYESASLVLCPGAWASDLLNDLQIPFDVRRHVMCWFEPKAQADLFSPERFPIYIWDVNGVDCFYGFPALDGSGVKAAMHSGGDRCSADNIDRSVNDRDVAELRAHLSTFIPALDGPLLKASACMYTLTPDEHFVVTLHPQSPNVAVAAGFSGHGFKFTPVIGEILAQLVCDGATEHPIELFSPERFFAYRR